MWRERARASRNHAVILDRDALPFVWGEKALPARGHLQGNVVLAVAAQAGPISEALMGEMKRAEARYREEFHREMEEQKRMKSTLVIGACIIAAVRLARDADISRPSPRLTSVIAESVGLAKMILAKLT